MSNLTTTHAITLLHQVFKDVATLKLQGLKRLYYHFRFTPAFPQLEKICNNMHKIFQTNQFPFRSKHYLEYREIKKYKKNRGKQM